MRLCVSQWTCVCVFINLITLQKWLKPHLVCHNIHALSFYLHGTWEHRISCKRHKEDYLRWKSNHNFNKCTQISNFDALTHDPSLSLSLAHKWIRKYFTAKQNLLPFGVLVYSPMNAIQFRASKWKKVCEFVKIPHIEWTTTGEVDFFFLPRINEYPTRFQIFIYIHERFQSNKPQANAIPFQSLLLPNSRVSLMQ